MMFSMPLKIIPPLAYMASQTSKSDVLISNYIRNITTGLPYKKQSTGVGAHWFAVTERLKVTLAMCRLFTFLFLVFLNDLGSGKWTISCTKWNGQFLASCLILAKKILTRPAATLYILEVVNKQPMLTNIVTQTTS